jgi:SpoVK/Ycf46/Vps4 family AAA+-type ATPase
MQGDVNELRALLASRHGILFAHSRDEARLLTTISEAARDVGIPVWTWSAASGLRTEHSQAAQVNTDDLRQALSFVRDLSRPMVATLLDADQILDDPVALRILKEIAAEGMANRTVILTGMPAQIPDVLAGVAVTWSLRLLTRSEVEQHVERTVNSLRRSVRVTDLDMDRLVDAVLGLSQSEAERLIVREAVTDGELSGEDAERIHRAKAEILSEDSPLDLMDAEVTLADVGGLENLKQWLAVRGRGFGPEAKQFGLTAPKGVLLVGVPGCGKSLVARAIAGTWGMALAALDTSRLHGSFIGESEKRIKRALDAAEAMAPVVLWVDEIEKAFSGTSDHDGGASGRVMSVLLNWLQERPDGVFIVATSNDVTRLPPEMTRRGRFDEVFFIDLPNTSERLAILAHHLRSKNRDPARFSAQALADATEGFSGAEIESAITAALYLAFAEGAALDTERLVRELNQTVPLSRMRPEEIAQLRQWGRQHARRASAEDAS